MNLRRFANPWLLFALGVILLRFTAANNYYFTLLNIIGIHAILVVGLNLLLGYAGQISLGHAAFFGLGAYTSGILTATWGVNPWLALPAGLVVAGVAAFLVGVPALKLRGYYLAMATLGFGIILSILFTETVDITGGPSGFVGIPRLSLFGWELRKDVTLFRLVAVILCLFVWLSFNLLHSRVGRALRALHTSERAAEAMGVDIANYKLLVFVLSAAFSGFAGVLYAHYLTFIAPSSFGFMFSVELIVMVVLGGMVSVPGAIVGAFFVTVLPEFLRAFENVEVLLFGAILVLCMMFLPDGIAGGWRRLLDWGKARFSGASHG